MTIIMIMKMSNLKKMMMRLSEYKENSYDQYIELLEQKTKERNSILLIDDYYNSRFPIIKKRLILNKDDSKENTKVACPFTSTRTSL